MKAIIFNGSLERRAASTSGVISGYFEEQLTMLDIQNEVFTLADSGIPLFDTSLTKTPLEVERMSQMFRDADLHFWLAPLYHGSIPGVMKNCLDWLEVTANRYEPYLTDKTIGLVCWADGLQAMQGINAMDNIAKSLRAWPLPFSVPVIKTSLFDPGSTTGISPLYLAKFDKLISIATTKRIEKTTINQL
ncbi:NAD(P)H-dependent oxidoreductase [Empedobacter brevis]|uniref:NADPH-dependent FMN reductase n=1 Tax=Empedobacter brevis TaxID=247 RepID=UPI00123DA52B|nr:NADPH-dependent FMN reductase [Empedobacter brevis]QES93975.1 NAD(P)H-dependent oxidoreductase [Empedobacter brevis]QHC85781.1 NADPH-dependent FMN reductase [Empedobacter brevis]